MEVYFDFETFPVRGFSVTLSQYSDSQTRMTTERDQTYILTDPANTSTLLQSTRLHPLFSSRSTSPCRLVPGLSYLYPRPLRCCPLDLMPVLVTEIVAVAVAVSEVVNETKRRVFMCLRAVRFGARTNERPAENEIEGFSILGVSAGQS